jgi:ribosomal protein L16/L10AE
MHMKNKKSIKVRVSPEGFMGSASQEHRVKKGKGSFRRRKKHQKILG